MFHKNDPYLTVPLLKLAEEKFPKLMRHRTNREDALQVLRMVQWQTKGNNALPVAERELVQLEVDLGLRIPAADVEVARQAA